MAARQARNNVALTDEAKTALGEFRRTLSVKLGVDATYSDAIVYAIKRTTATDAALDDTEGGQA